MHYNDCSCIHVSHQLRLFMETVSSNTVQGQKRYPLTTQRALLCHYLVFFLGIWNTKLIIIQYLCNITISPFSSIATSPICSNISIQAFIVKTCYSQKNTKMWVLVIIVKGTTTSRILDGDMLSIHSSKNIWKIPVIINCLANFIHSLFVLGTLR